MDACAPRATEGPIGTDPRTPPTLFETMRWENGELRRWQRHLARIAASAVAMGYPFDASAAVATVSSAIAAAAATGTDGVPSVRGAGALRNTLRVRLELRPNGAFHATARAHHDTDAGTALGDVATAVVVWSTAPIRADDPARRHKTTDRALYDAATVWAAGAGVADVLFVNEHGRVVEGAISNVFVRGSDDRWRTPPVEDGALPGVLRAELIEQRRAVEAPLSPEDLLTGSLAIGSALRGLRPVRLTSGPTWSPHLARRTSAHSVPGGEP